MKNNIVLSCNVVGILRHYSLTQLIYSTAEYFINKYYSVCLIQFFTAPSNFSGYESRQT